MNKTYSAHYVGHALTDSFTISFIISQFNRALSSNSRISTVVSVTTFTISTLSAFMAPATVCNGYRPHPILLSSGIQYARMPDLGISRGMGQRSENTQTTHDGCFSSCSSISHPMIHFTDTWVITGLSSSPLGMKLHENSQGRGTGVGAGWCRRLGRKKEVSEWKQRQEWWDWGQSKGCSEIQLTAHVDGLVQEKTIFSETPCCSKLITDVWALQSIYNYCNKKNNENMQCMTFKVDIKTKAIKRAVWDSLK